MLSLTVRWNWCWQLKFENISPLEGSCLSRNDRRTTERTFICGNLTSVSGEQQRHKAGGAAQEQSQHAEGTPIQADQRDEQAGSLGKAGEELGRVDVHAEGADVQTDAVVRQRRRSTDQSQHTSQFEHVSISP